MFEVTDNFKKQIIHERTVLTQPSDDKNDATGRWLLEAVTIQTYDCKKLLSSYFKCKSWQCYLKEVPFPLSTKNQSKTIHYDITFYKTIVRLGYRFQC